MLKTIPTKERKDHEDTHLVFQTFGDQALSSVAFPGISYSVITFSDMSTSCVGSAIDTKRAEGDERNAGARVEGFWSHCGEPRGIVGMPHLVTSQGQTQN